MPILEVEIILRPGELLTAGLSSQIADQAAAALAAPPGRTWVKLRTLLPDQYAEDGANTPTSIYPVFVSVLKADPPPPDELAAEVTRLTEAIANTCDRPSENVHILYEPPARGRIAFGGRLI